MWPRIANYRGLEAASHQGEGLRLEQQLVVAAPVWKSIAESTVWLSWKSTCLQQKAPTASSPDSRRPDEHSSWRPNKGKTQVD